MLRTSIGIEQVAVLVELSSGIDVVVLLGVATIQFLQLLLRAIRELIESQLVAQILSVDGVDKVLVSQVVEVSGVDIVLLVVLPESSKEVLADIPCYCPS